jgi:hypothetical protein
VVVGAALVAGLVPAIYPLTPGFSTGDATAAVVGAVVAATAAIAFVPITLGVASDTSRRYDGLIYAIALFSAAAGAIHLAVAKTHFDEYALFGVFFVGSGIAQLVWSAWILVRRWAPLLVLGAVGNALIVALWGVDRIWGLPIGPEQWEPESIGFGDVATSTFEVLVVAGCVAAHVGQRTRRLRPALALGLTLAVAAATTLSLLSVLGVGSSILTPTG